MDPSLTQGRHPAFRLKDALRKQMQRYSEPQNRFVTGSIIEKIWASDPQGLRDQLGLSSEFSDEHLAYIDEHLQRVACIFAWFGIDNFAYNLRRLLPLRTQREVSETGQNGVPLRDSDLPLTRDRCYELFGEDTGQDFFDTQFIFKVIAINQFSKGVVEQWRESRFPFTSPPKPIAAGAYGDVFEVTIIKGQLRPAPNESNYDDRKVALKRIRQARDWLKEVRSLDVLQESLAKHDRLTLHLAAMVRGDDFYLFLPFTQLGDLELFLQEGGKTSGDAETALDYNFQEYFPHITLKDILHEFATLAGAIDFLHNHVSSRRNVPVYCAHVDLRPKNVLVFPPDSSNPAGVWKISDFGISSFKLAQNEPAWQQYPSIGDVAASRWYQSSGSSLPNLQGPHRAPELSVRRGYPLQMPATDIWALGCILYEVLVFGTGGDQPGQRKQRLEKFRNQRRTDQDDVGDLRSDSFHISSYHPLESAALSPEQRGRLTFQLRPVVREWLDDLAEIPYCNNVVSIIRCMLHPNPNKRLKADQVFNLMRDVCSTSSSNNSRLLEEAAALQTAAWSIAIRRDNDTFIFEHEIEPDTSPRPAFRILASDGRSISESPTNSSVGTPRSRSRSRTPSWADGMKPNEVRNPIEFSTTSAGNARAVKPYDARLVFRDNDTASTTSSRSHDRLQAPVYPEPVRPRPSGTNTAAVNFFRAGLNQEQLISPPTVITDDKTETNIELPVDIESVSPAITTKQLRVIRRKEVSADINDFKAVTVKVPLQDEFLMYLVKTKVTQSKNVFKARRKEVFEVRLRKRNTPEPPSGWPNLPLPSGVDWSEVSVQSNLVAVLGTDEKQSGLSDLSLLDLTTMSAVEIPLEKQEINQLQKVTCSDGQQLAFCKAKEVILWRRGADPRRLPSANTSNLSHELVNAQFSHDSTFFFAWWRSANGDRLEIWDLKSATNPVLRAEFTISRMSSRIHNSFIVPCGNLPGCILRDSQGVVTSALALKPSKKPRRTEKQVGLSNWSFPKFRSLCCATNSQIFYVDDSSKIQSHKLSISSDQISLLVDKDSTFQDEKCPVEDATAVALQRHPTISENQYLRITNLSGAVYELELSEIQAGAEYPADELGPTITNIASRIRSAGTDRKMSLKSP